LTSRLPRVAESSVAAVPVAPTDAGLPPPNKRPTSLMTQDTIKTQNINLIRRPKNPITIKALASAPP
jgi:hypothetical protein